jgi:RND superfamily putative drug exporter
MTFATQVALHYPTGFPLAVRIVQHRRRIALACLAAAAFLLPLVPQVSDKLEIGGATVVMSESARVDALLKKRFVTPYVNNLVLVVTGIPSLETVAGIDALLETVELIKEIPSIAGVLSYVDPVDSMFLSEHGTFLVAGIEAGDRRMDEVVLELRHATQSLQTRLRLLYPEIDMAWTGAGALDYDLRLTSATDAAEAERRVLPVTAVLLFIVFGSVVSALCPIVIGGLGVALSLGAAVLLSAYWPMTILLQNIVTMIGLGIGIDYCLLMLSRFREELLVQRDAEQAAISALQTAGHTIVLSGGAVAIGFAALLLVPATELRSIATGGLLVVGFSVLLATVLLPGLLAWLGTRVETGRLWRPRVVAAPPWRWQAWGRWVTAHPLLVLMIFASPLALLAWQARHISTDIPTGTWLPEHMESTQGALALRQMGKSGMVQAIRVVVEFPEGRLADSEQGWQDIMRLSEFFESDDRVARVNSLPRLLHVNTVEQASRVIIPAQLRAAYISGDGQKAAIEIIPGEAASTGELMDYVRELRELSVQSDEAAQGPRILVGGLPALNADYQDAIGGSAIKVILLIVIGSFVALFIGFRSVLGAVKAVLLNLFSVAAAMGATVLVFQLGYGSAWLGVAEPLDGLFPAVPIIVFCVVFGLSMDYEVFLLSRVAEGVRSGKSNRDAIVYGLSRTAGIIAGAAMVMIVVFTGFALGDFLVIKILGFALAVAILFDATLVRLAIGPALLQLGGRWNWWPGLGISPNCQLAERLAQSRQAI